MRVGALAAPLCGPLPAGALRRGRHGRHEALRARRAVRRRLRQEGLPAARDPPAPRERPLLSGRDRRAPHRSRAGRARDELAQRLPVAADSAARARSVARARRGVAGVRGGERERRGADGAPRGERSSGPPTSIDYVEVTDADSLAPCAKGTRASASGRSWRSRAASARRGSSTTSSSAKIRSPPASRGGSPRRSAAGRPSDVTPARAALSAASHEVSRKVRRARRDRRVGDDDARGAARRCGCGAKSQLVRTTREPSDGPIGTLDPPGAHRARHRPRRARARTGRRWRCSSRPTGWTTSRPRSSRGSRAAGS